MPAPKSVTEFNFIGVYSSDSGRTLTRIALPSPLHVPPSLSGLYSRLYVTTRVSGYIPGDVFQPDFGPGLRPWFSFAIFLLLARYVPNVAKEEYMLSLIHI